MAMIVFGTIVRTYEVTLDLKVVTDASSVFFKTYFNSFWFLCVTMTTGILIY